MANYLRISVGLPVENAEFLSVLKGIIGELEK
jgi:histidinol-phosphate/aromatic aminotransferase/cobyric acid decarboxylase-like protein